MEIDLHMFLTTRRAALRILRRSTRKPRTERTLMTNIKDISGMERGGLGLGPRGDRLGLSVRAARARLG